MNRNTIMLAFLILLLGGGINTANADPGIAEGAKLWAETCSRCHNMRDPQEFTADLWHPTVAHMRVRAGITGQEAREILTFLHASAHGQSGFSSPDSAETQKVSVGASGEELYQGTCIACHGEKGKGMLPGMPDFRKSDGPLAKPTSALVDNVENGYQSDGSTFAMPPNGGNSALTRDQAESIVEYMKENFLQK